MNDIEISITGITASGYEFPIYFEDFIVLVPEYYLDFDGRGCA